MGLFLGAFIQSRKCVSLKFIGELCVMRMKNDAKFEEQLLVNLKLTWVIWWILSQALKNLNLNFNELLLTKVYNAWTKKKYRGVMFDCTEDWFKIWRPTYLYFLKWHEEFGKFSPDHIWKSKNWVFSWVLLSKVENVWAWNL